MGSERAAPISTRSPSPPLGPVGKIHRAARATKNGGPGDTEFRTGAGILRRIDGTLSHCYVARRVHESCKLPIRDRTAIDRERLYADAPSGTLLGIEVIRSHKELAAFDRDDLTGCCLGCHRVSTLAATYPGDKPLLQVGLSAPGA